MGKVSIPLPYSQTLSNYATVTIICNNIKHSNLMFEILQQRARATLYCTITYYRYLLWPAVHKLSESKQWAWKEHNNSHNNDNYTEMSLYIYTYNVYACALYSHIYIIYIIYMCTYALYESYIYTLITMAHRIIRRRTWHISKLAYYLHLIPESILLCFFYRFCVLDEELNDKAAYATYHI